jgi:hypothetical protein
MKRFDIMLEESVSGYEGKFSEIVCEIPAFYRLMVRLLDDSNLPKQPSQLVIASNSIFYSPIGRHP